MNYQKLSEQETADLALVSGNVRRNRQVEREFINAWAPRVIGAVIGGDNIVHVNDLVDVFPAGVDKDRLLKVIGRYLPYKTEDGVFTKKDNAGAVKRKTQAFKELPEDVDFYDLWMTQQKKDRAEKPKDYIGAIQRDVAAAVEHGFTADQILTIVQAAVDQAAVAAIAQQMEKPAEQAQVH